jgi:cyclic pyranopterin monophosphate synthase
MLQFVPTMPMDSDSPRLTHVDANGTARMVDVSSKPLTARLARAEASVRLPETIRAQAMSGSLPKGDALTVARIAAIQAAKETSRLIPLCHPLALSHVQVDFEARGRDEIAILVEARTIAGTGVEMEAMTAAAVAALTLYDMVKGACREARIERVELLHKSGGKSGDWNRS